MKIIFIGAGDIGLPSLKALAESSKHEIVGVITHPDRLVGRQQILTENAIKQEAIRQHLKIFQPENINHKPAIAQLRYLQPELMVVVAYGQILSKEVLAVPSHGCLNLHASLLPKHRGATPIQAAILAGDRKTGMTVMWMDEGLDSGDILLQETTALRSKDTAGVVSDRLATLGAKAILRSLDLIEKNRAPHEPQDHAHSTYSRKMRKKDGEIDWAKSNGEVDRHIRAMTPWPSAFTWVQDPKTGAPKMLKIFATILSRRAEGAPGEIVRIDKHGLLVATGKGGLLLREVQLEGKKRMHARDFARGFDLTPGIILGAHAPLKEKKTA